MGAHEQTFPSRESGGLDPKDLERTVEEEIKDMKPSVETPGSVNLDWMITSWKRERKEEVKRDEYKGEWDGGEREERALLVEWKK